jgi:ribosomal protein S18 acetylase RimI-like enzyme
MPFTIRPAERRDHEALGRLGAMLMRTHYAFDPQRFLAPHEDAERGYGSFLTHVMRAEDNLVLVADDGGNVAGYVYAALEPLSWKELRGPAGFIHDVAVDEASRHAGVATALMQAAIAWLRERGAPRVILWSAAPNEAAQRLFAQHFGFRTTMLEMTLEL